MEDQIDMENDGTEKENSQDDKQTQGQEETRDEESQDDSDLADDKTIETEQPQEDDKTLPGKDSSVRVNAETLKAERFYAAEKQQFTEYRNYILGSEEGPVIRPFSPNHAIHIPLESIQKIADTYVYDEADISRPLAILHEKRLVVIVGEPETGKRTTALYLGHKLHGENAETCDGIYQIPSLDRNVKINIHEVINNPEDFGNRILFFKDVFALGNRDILEFFTSLDMHVLMSISETLRTNNMYLVFTADSLTAADCQSQLSQLKIECELSQLSDTLLRKGLEHKLKQFSDSENKTFEVIGKALGNEYEQFIVEKLRKMTSIARFVDDYLIKIIDGGPDVDIEELIRHVDDLAGWFLTDLADDVEAWCFALSLALSQYSSYSPGIPWFEFEDLRNAISKHLKREFKLPDEEVDIRNVMSEDPLLKRCRAEILRDPDTGIDMVRFSDGRYPGILWDVLLNHNRRLLTVLIPLLKKMAEGREPVMRACAARILGRMGKIDPSRVSFPLINQWANSKELYQQATVGYLYQGIFATQEKHYRESSLRVLRSLSDSEERSHQWTAIATYKQLGIYDLPLAMRELGEIAKGRFTEKIEDTQRIDRILNRIEHILRDHDFDTDTHTVNWVAYHEILREIARRIFSEEGAILFATQYAIVSLCLAVDPIQVFEELRKWMAEDERTLTVLVALIFLQEGGIAEELEKRTIEISATGVVGNSQVMQCNAIVVSIVSSENSVRQMTRFLADVFAGFRAFSRRSRQYLLRSFLMHLKKWVKDAYPIEKCRAAMEQLIAELSLVPDKELHDQILAFLKNDPDFAERDSDLYTFADAVSKRILDTPQRKFPWLSV